MKELIDINRYLHDFASAVWVCGSILLWMMLREARREGISTETAGVLVRLGARFQVLTIPALLITLATGGVRAATFAKYEYVGEITSSVVTGLIVKHILFAVVVGWGIWVHWKTRTSIGLSPDGG